MKLAKLALTNFRCHKKLSLTLAPVTVITGANGAGKSSVQAALEWLLSGSAPWPAEHLLAHGCKVTRVVATSTTGDTVTRAYEPHSLALSWAPSLKLREAQSKLEDAMRCSADRARLCLRAGRFFGVDGKQQVALLYDLLGCYLGPPQIADHLKRLTVHHSLPLDKVAHEVAGTPIPSVAAGYKACYAERTVVGRAKKQAATRLTDAQARLAEQVFEPSWPTDEALKKAEEVYSRARVARETAKRTQAERAHLIAKIAEAEAAPAVDASGLTADLERTSRALDLLTAKLEGIRLQERERNSASVRLMGLTKEIEDLERVLGGEQVCPWRADYPCTREHGPEVEERLERLRFDVEELTPAASAPSQAAAISQLEERIARGKAKAKELQLALQSERAAAERAARIATWRERLAELPEVDVDALDGQCALLAKTLDGLAADRAAADRYQKAQDAVTAAERDLADADARHRCLDVLCQVFGERGIQLEVLTANIEPLQEELRGALSLVGMDARYRLPDLTLEVQTTADGPWVEYDALSDGEALSVAWAHQVAFAVLTGLRIVVLDRVEALDARHQDWLLSHALASVDAGHIDHALLLGVRWEGAAPPNHIKLKGGA